jgi:hypothetical protein
VFCSKQQNEILHEISEKEEDEENGAANWKQVERVCRSAKYNRLSIHSDTETGKLFTQSDSMWKQRSVI